MMIDNFIRVIPRPFKWIFYWKIEWEKSLNWKFVIGFLIFGSEFVLRFDMPIWCLRPYQGYPYVVLNGLFTEKWDRNNIWTEILLFDLQFWFNWGCLLMGFASMLPLRLNMTGDTTLLFLTYVGFWKEKLYFLLDFDQILSEFCSQMWYQYDW